MIRVLTKRYFHTDQNTYCKMYLYIQQIQYIHLYIIYTHALYIHTYKPKSKRSREGEVVYGNKKFGYILSRNSSESLFHISKYLYQDLPLILCFCFQKKVFQSNFFFNQKGVVKIFWFHTGCPYMQPMIVFLLLILFMTSIKTD